MLTICCAGMKKRRTNESALAIATVLGPIEHAQPSLHGQTEIQPADDENNTIATAAPAPLFTTISILGAA